MKAFLAVILILVSLPASARLGWTQKQIEKKFGKHVKTSEIYGAKAYGYVKTLPNKIRFLIIVVYKNKIAEAVCYVKTETQLGMSKPFDDDELKNFLAINSQGQKWEKISAISMSKFWKRTDGGMAQYAPLDGTLMVMTKRFYEYSTKQQEKEAKKNVEDNF